MTSYYEEHNVKPVTSSKPDHHITLTQHLNDFFSVDASQTGAAVNGGEEQRTPETSASQLEHALRQFQDSPLAQQLAQQLETNPNKQGVPQSFIDALDRVEKKRLKQDDSCAICTARYLDDPYPLVARLPCNPKHHFDLECIGPWLKVNATCPMCRKDMLEKKEQLEDSEEEFDDTYG